MVQVAAADELTTSVVGDVIGPPMAAISRPDAEIAAIRRRTATRVISRGHQDHAASLRDWRIPLAKRHPADLLSRPLGGTRAREAVQFSVERRSRERDGDTPRLLVRAWHNRPFAR